MNCLEYNISLVIYVCIVILYNNISIRIEVAVVDTFIDRSRTVTRSTNKGVKGDLASVMEKQVVRCDEPIEPLLKTFFKNEHLDIG